MNRNQMLGGIFRQFDALSQAFCDDTEGLFCEISNEYKGSHQPGNLKRKTAKIYYSSFAVSFVYTAHGFLGVVNSILSCNVYLSKEEAAPAIPLPLITDYCEMDVAAPLCIPLITGEQAMVQAFGCIADVLGHMLPVLAKVSADRQMLEQLQKQYTREIQHLLQLPPSDEPLQPQIWSWAEGFFVGRFSGEPFLSALRGNYEKASRQLRKTKQLTGYEKRMLRLWLEKAQLASVQLPAVTKAAKAFRGTGTSKIERKELLSAFASWFVLCPVFSLLYLGLYALLVWIAGWNGAYLLGPQYGYPYCIITGLLTAIIVSWFTRFFFFRLLFQKDYAQYQELESIQNLESRNKLMKAVLGVVVAGCIAFSALLANSNLKFTQDGFVDNSAFFSLKGNYHSYHDVEYVYYKPDRVNGLGETLDRPSYVIVLKSGQEIDLHKHGAFSDYSGELIAFLREKGIEIVR